MSDHLLPSVPMSCIRWFFNASKWRPTKEEWLLALHCVQNEEISRINRFVFKKDSKLSLIGRLLMRSCVQKCFNFVDYKDIRFGRSERGKPFVRRPLMNTMDTQFDLNISHSGNYCVIASDMTSKIGVDVMKIEYSGQHNDRPLEDFFRIMNRQFSQSEWHFITSGENDWQKLSRFIRLWTLKESYVKAEGIGIAFDLKRISFQCPTHELRTGSITYDTVIRVDNRSLEGWIFEESLLDSNHCICVAKQDKQNNSIINSQQFVFIEKTITELLEEAVPLDADKSVEQTLWTDFEKKLNKP